MNYAVHIYYGSFLRYKYSLICCISLQEEGQDKAQQLKTLFKEKIAINEPYDEKELKDEIVPSQTYIWICGIAICLDIWLVVVIP